MAIVLVGASCSGKSAVARVLREELGFRVYQGRDYLNLGRNEEDAWQQFSEMLCNGDKGIIYVTGNIDKYKKLKDVDGTRIIKIRSPIEFMINSKKAKLVMDELPEEAVCDLQDDLANWDACEEEHTFVLDSDEAVEEVAKSILSVVAPGANV